MPHPQSPQTWTEWLTRCDVGDELRAGRAAIYSCDNDCGSQFVGPHNTKGAAAIFQPPGWAYLVGELLCGECVPRGFRRAYQPQDPAELFRRAQ